MRRRDVLAAVGAVLTAGCAGVLNGDGESAERTLTPAPVPAAERTARTLAPTRSPCPELPSNAEVYVCTPLASSDNSLLLVPERRTVPADDPVRFTLRNNTGFSFRTGRDWWTLARRSGRDWTIVDQGAGADGRVIEPGTTAGWALGDEDLPPRADVGLDPGGYALAVTGYVSGGELTSVMAPFEVV